MLGKIIGFIIMIIAAKIIITVAAFVAGLAMAVLY
jgi:hypothetical protein